MEKIFDRFKLEIGQAQETPFMNKYNIYQDGTTPMYRDVDGTLWAISGHTHMGSIAMFSGTCLDDLTKRYDIDPNFATGHAEYAFSGIRYPEGIQARGSIWPFGLYICPNTHRFFCWFHNETGWNGKGTAYDCFGPCIEPKVDSDFRHTGLMHSDDEGRSWIFDRWVLTGNEISVTDRYNAGSGKYIGQNTDGLVRMGCGDFSLFVEPEGEFIYLFYTMLTLDLHAKERWDVVHNCDACVARCRKRTDGTMGDFVKFYEGSFCEAGNLGRESVILEDAWHPRVLYWEPEKMYIMTSKAVNSVRHCALEELVTDGKALQISVSKDLVHWSKPELFLHNGRAWGNVYQAIIPDDKEKQPNILAGNSFSVFLNGNGTDVLRYPAKFVELDASKK